MLKCSTVPCLVCHTPRPPRTSATMLSRVSAAEVRLECFITRLRQHGT